MTNCDLSRVWAREAADEPYIRPSWHVTIANEENCRALGMPYDATINKAVFAFGLVTIPGELSLMERRPTSWPSDKLWQPAVVVNEKELFDPEKIRLLEKYWIGPRKVEEAKALIEKEGYAPKVSSYEQVAEVVSFPPASYAQEQRIKQMAAQIPSGPNLQHE
jgi:hypothetical protein